MNRVRAFITANRSWLPWAVGGVFLALAAVLPLLAIEIPGVFPGASYTPGTLQLLALCLLFASLALSYHLLFGTVGLLSFGHALYFAVGAYGLGIVLGVVQQDAVQRRPVDEPNLQNRVGLLLGRSRCE